MSNSRSLPRDFSNSGDEINIKALTGATSNPEESNVPEVLMEHSNDEGAATLPGASSTKTKKTTKIVAMIRASNHISRPQAPAKKNSKDKATEAGSSASKRPRTRQEDPATYVPLVLNEKKHWKDAFYWPDISDE